MGVGILGGGVVWGALGTSASTTLGTRQATLNEAKPNQVALTSVDAEPVSSAQVLAEVQRARGVVARIQTLRGPLTRENAHLTGQLAEINSLESSLIALFRTVSRRGNQRQETLAKLQKRQGGIDQTLRLLAATETRLNDLISQRAMGSVSAAELNTAVVEAERLCTENDVRR